MEDRGIGTASGILGIASGKLDLLVPALLLLCTLPWSFRTTSFLHAKDAGICAALLVVAFLSIRVRFVARTHMVAFLPLWIALGWTLVFHGLGGQARVPADAISTSLRYSAVLLVAAGLLALAARSANRQTLQDSILLSAAIAAILAILQYAGLAGPMFPAFADYPQRAYSVFGNQDLLGGYMAIALPLATGFIVKAKTPTFIWLAPVPLVIALGISGSRSAWLAAIAGTAIVLVASARPNRRLLCLLALFVALGASTVVAAPEPTISRAVSAVSGDDIGVGVRLWIWDGTLGMIREHPLFGVGLGNFAVWSPYYLGKALSSPGGGDHLSNERHTLHAHNDPLELLAELGLPGLACLAWMLFTLRHGRNAPGWGALGASLVFSLFNGMIESPAHMLVSLLVAGGLSLKSDEPTGYRIGAKLLTPLCCVLVAAVSWSHLIPSYRLQAAWLAEDSGRDPVPEYRRALDHPWPNARAAEEFANELVGRQRYEEAGEPLELARRGSDTGRLHLLSGLVAESRGNIGAARRHYDLCLQRWPANKEIRRRLAALAKPGPHGAIDASRNSGTNSP